METQRLLYYFDFLSPYSYLAWTWLRDQEEYFKAHSVQLELKPVIMAKVIKSHDTKGPAEIETKRNYLLKDCLRFSALNKIPFNPPHELPFNSLEALRLSLCPESLHKKVQITDALFKMAWVESIDLTNIEQMAKYLEGQDISIENLFELSSRPSVRRFLKTNTQEAIGLGLFGVPSFVLNKVADTELFWGNDSIDSLRNSIENKDNLNIEKYQQFLKVFH